MSDTSFPPSRQPEPGIPASGQAPAPKGQAPSERPGHSDTVPLPPGVRARNLDALGQLSSPDVLILGGGVNGVACLRELALNGVSCVLIEQDDFARGASSASSRMAHGGLRYLEGREFRLVAESARERNRLIAHAGHVVKPLEITVPLDHLTGGFGRSVLRFLGLSRRSGPLSLLALEGALRLYEAFGRREHPLPSHRTVLRRAQFPKGLRAQTRAVVSYYDGQITQPEGLIFEMLAEAQEVGGAQVAALNHMGWQRQGDAIVIEDRFGPTRVTLKPRLVINATGAWIDQVNGALGGATRYLRAVKGAHLVLNNPALYARMAGRAFYFDDGTGRMVITLPVGENILVGTTEVEITDPEDRSVSSQEIGYLLRAMDGLFQDIRVEASQIVSMTSGIRPLRRGEGTGSATSAARDHALEEDHFAGFAPPVLSLVGGKWTTFRAFGEETADRVLALLDRSRQVSTQARPYPGAVGGSVEALCALGLSEPLATRLLARYGALAMAVAPLCLDEGGQALVDAPDLCRGELRYAIRARGALRIEDLVLRRSRLSFGAGLSARTLQELGEILQAETGRAPEAIAQEVGAVLEDPRLMGGKALLEEALHERRGSDRD